VQLVDWEPPRTGLKKLGIAVGEAELDLAGWILGRNIERTNDRFRTHCSSEELVVAEFAVDRGWLTRDWASASLSSPTSNTDNVTVGATTFAEGC
jgi:hypothetical protein